MIWRLSVSSWRGTPSHHPYLVGGFSPPLWKIWLRQLGWWNSQYFWEKCQKWQPNHQPVNYGMFYMNSSCESTRAIPTTVSMSRLRGPPKYQLRPDVSQNPSDQKPCLYALQMQQGKGQACPNPTWTPNGSRQQLLHPKNAGIFVISSDVIRRLTFFSDWYFLYDMFDNVW